MLFCQSIVDSSARGKFADAKAKLGKGFDPGKELIEERKSEREADTVADLAEKYLKRWARPRKRSAHEDERILSVDILPIWEKDKARDITRKAVIALLDGIVDRGAPIGQPNPYHFKPYV